MQLSLADVSPTAEERKKLSAIDGNGSVCVRSPHNTTSAKSLIPLPYPTPPFSLQEQG